MIWEIWDVVDFGFGELSPSTKVNTYDNFTEAFCEFKRMSLGGDYVLIPNKENKKYIYESPDNGKTIYRREFLTNKREII